MIFLLQRSLRKKNNCTVQQPMRNQSKPHWLYHFYWRRCISTHMMEMIAPKYCDEKTKNAEIAGFLRRNLL